MPDETTILRFRQLLEEHNLGIQLLATINATLIAKGLMRTKMRLRMRVNLRLTRCSKG
jgi:IS5 family transposase